MKTYDVTLNLGNQGDQVYEMVMLEDVQKIEAEMWKALNLIMGIGCIPDSDSPQEAAKSVDSIDWFSINRGWLCVDKGADGYMRYRLSEVVRYHASDWEVFLTFKWGYDTVKAGYEEVGKAQRLLNALDNHFKENGKHSHD